MLNRYYVFTDNGVLSGRNVKALNKKYKLQLNENDFVVLGSDRVVFLSKEDISYIKDLHYLSQIPISMLYKLDRRPLYFNIANFIFIIICLMQIAGTRGLVQQLITALGG